MSQPKIIPYDPVAHKDYVLLIKGTRAHYFPPDKVLICRMKGWRTIKEYQEIQAGRARKAAKDTPVITVADAVFNNEDKDQ